MPQIRRLRIEIEKLQWLHQQELSEMKHNLGGFAESRNHRTDAQQSAEQMSRFRSSSWRKCRADDGRDEAEPGAGAGAVGGRGEEADGGRKAAGRGRDQKETVVRQLQEGGHLLLLLEHELLRLPLSTSPLAGAHEVLHSVR